MDDCHFAYFTKLTTKKIHYSLVGEVVGGGGGGAKGVII
jgi:hypothetical protein